MCRCTYVHICQLLTLKTTFPIFKSLVRAFFTSVKWFPPLTHFVLEPQQHWHIVSNVWGSKHKKKMYNNGVMGLVVLGRITSMFQPSRNVLQDLDSFLYKFLQELLSLAPFFSPLAASFAKWVPLNTYISETILL